MPPHQQSAISAAVGAHAMASEKVFDDCLPTVLSKHFDELVRVTEVAVTELDESAATVDQ